MLVFYYILLKWELPPRNHSSVAGVLVSVWLDQDVASINLNRRRGDRCDEEHAVLTSVSHHGDD